MRKKLTGQLGHTVTLTREIGRGGFGVVYLAKDQAGSEYAVKFIENVTDEVVRASFLQELHSVQGLSHPSIISIIDYGEYAPRKGRPGLFTVMEYCPDGDYRRLLESSQNGRRDPIVVLGEFRQILGALEALHQRVIHRDLKPENILLKDGQLKITDFGLAKFVDQATRTLTFKGAGTPRYMAPEVWNMGTASPATDLYAAGIILFEALAGEPPFVASTANDLRDQHLYSPAPRIRNRNAAIPERVDALLCRLLEKEPGRRYQSAAEVLAALERPSEAADTDLRELATRVRRQHDAQVATRLAREREAQREADEGAKDRYMEQEVLRLIDEVVAGVNAQLEETKIVRRESPPDAAYRLGNRELVVHFFRRGEMFENPVVPGRMELLRKRHVVHGGFIEIRDMGQDREGWNLVLVRPPESVYGEWRIVETDINPLMGKVARHVPFATQAQLFADNLACHWGVGMHSYVLRDRELERSDILRILHIFVPPV
jgi:hypothetical protein